MGEWEGILMFAKGESVKMNRLTPYAVYRALNKSKDDSALFQIAVFSEICTFDDKQWTMDQIGNMDYRDYEVLVREYNNRYKKS